MMKHVAIANYDMVLFKYSLKKFRISTLCDISTIMAKVIDINTHDLQYVVSLATQSLKSGNIIAVPTDTIYGVAGLAQRNDATSRIYQLKNRDLKKPIAISVADIDDVYKWGHVTVSRELLSELLPGPVTVVFTRKEFPGDDSSQVNSEVYLQEFRELWPMLDLVVDGGMLGNTTESRQGSTVVDLSQTGMYRIIRDGSALRPTSELLEKHGLKNVKSSDLDAASITDR
ncbi:threonylcarbamoyl-AMP synthase-like [Argopecten irradians]|uniref:threonylcarbamoyl-AMP synthase-like n=1 Tax=Argopecten irradians TaxID=31199 RepID=UPI003721DEC0